MVETKPFLHKLQGQASFHSGGPVKAHLPEPSPGTPRKVRGLRAAQGGWTGPGQQGGTETGTAEDRRLPGWSRRKELCAPPPSQVPFRAADETQGT